MPREKTAVRRLAYCANAARPNHRWGHGACADPLVRLGPNFAGFIWTWAESRQAHALPAPDGSSGSHQDRGWTAFDCSQGRYGVGGTVKDVPPWLVLRPNHLHC
jgi:hypothetical protein